MNLDPMRLQRLRSRLIAAFLGVALLAMLPLTIIPYFLLARQQAEIRSDYLQAAQSEIEKRFDENQTILQTRYLNRIQNYFQFKINHFSDLETYEQPDWMDFVYVMQHSDEYSADDLDEKLRGWSQRCKEEILENLGTRNRFVTLELELLPLAKYQSSEWLTKETLYEQDNIVYSWVFSPLYKGLHRNSMEVIGAVLLRTPLILKNSSAEGNRLYLDFKKSPNVYFSVVEPISTIFEPHLSPEDLEKLFDQKQEGDFAVVDLRSVRPFFLKNSSEDVEQKTNPVQAKMIPLVNQLGFPAAILVLYYPIVDLWQMIGFNTVVSFVVTLCVIILAAMLVARSIINPILNLATAAHRISNGDFDVRVPIAGSTEQTILSSTFNLMADRIQNQLEQLQQKTGELQDSNQELAQTHNFLRNILANISTGVMSIDREGRINHVNSIGQKILRLNACTGQSVEEVISSAPFQSIIRHTLKNGESVYQQEIACELETGEVIPLQISSVPILETGNLKGAVVTFHDLSTIRRLEEQVRRQERLAALGSMVAGVAHEIRNPLGIIRGSAELLNKRFGGQKEEAGLSEFIIDEVNRLSRVVNEFLMFARPPVPNIEEIPVKPFIDTVLSYRENQYGGESYEFVRDIQEGIPAIAADPGLSKQVFLNLLINAQDAMPDGGTIVIRAQRRNKHEVAIEVIDKGCGIESNRLERIFDPFFTSKESGTGLGLSLVHQIMSSHNGKVEVESTPTLGSTFRVIFPTYSSVLSTQERSVFS